MMSRYQMPSINPNNRYCLNSACGEDALAMVKADGAHKKMAENYI
jgi:hypothetical protein